MIRFPLSQPPAAWLNSLLAAAVMVGALGVSSDASAQGRQRTIDFEEALATELFDRSRNFYWTGRYDDCVTLCEAAIFSGREGFLMRALYLRSLLAMGEIERAQEQFEEIRRVEGDSIPLLMAGYHIAIASGRKEEAQTFLGEINRLALEKPRASLTSEELVALGEAAFLLGADPQKVLKSFFYEARKKGEIYPFSFLAAGRLALEKRDYATAAKEFRDGLKAYRADPDLHYGLAAAFFPDDRKEAGAHLTRALELNPRHVDSLVLQAEHFIDAEDYVAATALLNDALDVNEHHPEAWALRAVIAHFENDQGAMDLARERALAQAPRNPRVDHLIGKSLSRLRRFTEGAAYQRSALEADEEFLPARMQLALDLLRLGDEEAAWELAEQVREADEYNVMAFNLTKLRDQIAEYATIETDDFIIRLPKDEAAVYGDRALALLEEAKRVLAGKYGLTIEDPVLVEFFPSQQDFAVRTFGVPGGGGLLGVCFGSVITMNSPGGLAAGSNNWEATLWHEFCHVVTLGLTENRMPRWLSEGISVYEEIERDPTWGQHMNPRYRKMILEEDKLKPVMEISGLFMNPESGEDLMFAYYESALVVEYLIEEYGIERMQKLLRALGKGMAMEEALERIYFKVEFIDKGFQKFAMDRARSLGPEVDWSATEVDVLDPAAVAAFSGSRPDHFEAQKLHALHLLDAEEWEAAIEVAERLRRLYPGDIGENSAYLMLAKAHRELGNRGQEIEMLEALAERSADATPAYLRLMELALEDEDWPVAESNARRQLAVNPFLPRTHYCLGCAHEAAGETAPAAGSFRKVLMLGAEKPGEVHFRLARLLADDEPAAARRHVLDALAEAPRFREAQKLLVGIVEKHGPIEQHDVPVPAPPAPPPPAPPSPSVNR